MTLWTFPSSPTTLSGSKDEFNPPKRDEHCLEGKKSSKLNRFPSRSSWKEMVLNIINIVKFAWLELLIFPFDFNVIRRISYICHTSQISCAFSKISPSASDCLFDLECISSDDLPNLNILDSPPSGNILDSIPPSRGWISVHILPTKKYDILLWLGLGVITYWLAVKYYVCPSSTTKSFIQNFQKYFT